MRVNGHASDNGDYVGREWTSGRGGARAELHKRLAGVTTVKLPQTGRMCCSAS